MSSYIGIETGGRHPTATMLDGLGLSSKARTYSVKSPRACGIFYTESDVREEREYTVERTDILADFASVVMDKAIESMGLDRESIETAVTYPFGFTSLDIRKFEFALNQ